MWNAIKSVNLIIEKFLDNGLEWTSSNVHHLNFI